MGNIFILLVISVPVFYVIGLVAVVRSIFGKKKPQNGATATENSILADISGAAKRNDLPSVKRLLATAGYLQEEQAKAEIKEPAKPAVDLETSWKNWYSDNSINFLLYLGAFLIIVSAATFVGFNWETISGAFKSFILGALTVAFFGAGFYLFYQTSKVKRAGLTFLGIGSLLIPFNGLAWYNFVLISDVGSEVVWFFTSLVGVLVWAFLAVLIRKKFFTYIAGAGFISVFLSTVAILHLSFEFYTSAAIAGAFVFMFAHILAKDQKELEDFNGPFEQMAYVSIPVAIIFSFFAALRMQVIDFFTPLTTFNLVLISAFFAFGYWIKMGKIGAFGLIMAEIFGIVAAFSLTQAADLVLVTSLYVFMGCSLVYSALGLYFKQRGLQAEADSSYTLSLILASLVYLVGTFWPDVEPVNMAVAGIMTVGILWNMFFQYKKSELLYFKNAAWFLALWPALKAMGIPLLHYPYYFAGVSAVIYLASFVVSKRQQIAATYRNAGLIASVSSVILMFLISASGGGTADFKLNAIICGYFVGVLLLGDGVRFKSIYNYYLSAVALMLAFLWNLDYLAVGTLHVYTIIFGYFMGALVGFEAYRTKKFDGGVWASLILVGTLLWHFKYLELENIQYYSLTLAVYLFCLGYVFRRRKSEQTDLLDLGAGAVMVLPTFVQSLGDKGYLYALLLGFEGVILIFASMSIRNVIYRYVGGAAIALAVVSQTYEYLTSLPRWLITGFAGLVFLGVAIFLLASRKEKK